MFFYVFYTVDDRTHDITRSFLVLFTIFWDSFKLSLKLLEPGNVCVEGAAVILIIIIIITNTNRISNNI